MPNIRTNKRVTAVILKDDKILLIHRKKLGSEYWVVVGGGAEEGESVEEGLKREVLEETGLNLLSYKHLGDEKGEHGDWICFYLCTVEDGEPKLGGPEKDRHSPEDWYQLEWVPVKKLKDLSLYPSAVVDYVKKVFE